VGPRNTTTSISVTAPRLQEARDAAKSWGKDNTQIEALQADAKAKIAATKSEEWMINKSIHYNQWTTFQKAEFEAVVTAFREFVAVDAM
jgi:hypothetical protein